MPIEEQKQMAIIPLPCPRCGKPFLFDSEKWPPQRYCSRACSQYVRTKKWREKKKRQAPPQGGSSGTGSAGAQGQREDTSGSSKD